MNVAVLELSNWRRRVGRALRCVCAHDHPECAHAPWRSGRDALFRRHPQSPLPPEDPLRKTGVPYWDYNPAMRFGLPLLPVPAPQQRPAPADGDGTTTLRLIGYAALPAPVNATVDVWWLRQNGAGLFLPLRDGTAGDTSYAGGRYLLDTAKSVVGTTRQPRQLEDLEARSEGRLVALPLDVRDRAAVFAAARRPPMRSADWTS